MSPTERCCGAATGRGQRRALAVLAADAPWRRERSRGNPTRCPWRLVTLADAGCLDSADGTTESDPGLLTQSWLRFDVAPAACSGSRLCLRGSAEGVKS